MVHGSWGAPGVERYYRDIVTRDDSERRRRRPADVRPVVDRRPRIHMREPRRIMTRLGITLLVLYTLLRLARVGLEQGAEDQDYRNLPERPQPGLLDITGLDYRPVRTAHNPCHADTYSSPLARGGRCGGTALPPRCARGPCRRRAEQFRPQTAGRRPSCAGENRAGALVGPALLSAIAPSASPVALADAAGDVPPQPPKSRRLTASVGAAGPTRAGLVGITDAERVLVG